MSYQQLHEVLAISNRFIIAFLVNELFDKYQINLNDYKPTCGSTLSMTKNIFAFDHYDYANQLDGYYGKFDVEFKEKDFLQEFIKLGAYEFFNEYYKNYCIEIAKEFSERIKMYPQCDLIFNNMTDANPFAYSIEKDVETGLCVRSVAGKNLMQDSITILVDIHALIVCKIRESEVEGKLIMMPPDAYDLVMGKKND